MSGAYSGFNGATDLYRWKPRWAGAHQVGVQPASMGPPIYIGGNSFAENVTPCAIQTASMGPLIYIGGNVVQVFRRGIPFPSFNGATDLYRWKSPVNRASRSSPSSFNGATDLYRWKPPKYRPDRRATRRASMGPPIYIGGNGSAMRSEKLRRLMLQWGHRFISVETVLPIADAAVPHGASMGPPIYIGGNSTLCLPNQAACDASMGPPIYIGGNREEEANEEKRLLASMGPPIYIGGNCFIGRPEPTGKEELQWGHRFISVETSALTMGKSSIGLCFNGATDLYRWKRRKGAGVGGSGFASMGPPIYIGGNATGMATH